MISMNQIKDAGQNCHILLEERDQEVVLLGPEKNGIFSDGGNCWGHNLGRKGEAKENLRKMHCFEMYL